MNWFILIKSTLRTLCRSFHQHKFIIREENEGQRSIFKFRAKFPARGATDFKVYLSYFGNIGSKKFPESSYVKFMAPSEVNVLHFYR